MKHHLMLWYTLVLVVILPLGGVLSYTYVRSLIEQHIQVELDASTEGVFSIVQTASSVSVRTSLQAIAERNIDILNGLYEQVQDGHLTQAEAKDAARRMLLSQKIGKSGYVYIVNSSGVILVHPSKTLVGQRRSSQQPVAQQILQRRGFLEYVWANPDEPEHREKAMFMEYFEPWDWIVSVSAYKEDFAQLVDINDLRSTLSNFHVGPTGYIFIITGKGQVVFHPWLEGDISDNRTVDGIPFVRTMLENRNGSLKYAWQDPGQSEPRLKWMTFRYIPGVDWIVGSTGYLDEIYAPLYRLKYIIGISVCLTLLLLLVLSYLLGMYIARPLNKLVRRMREAEQGELIVRADRQAWGEAAEMAFHFNQYMSRIASYRDGLRDEIDERSRAEQRLKLFQKVFENALEGISITDKNGDIIAINPSFTVITGYTEEEVLGQNPRILKSDQHDDEFYSMMWSNLAKNGMWHGEIWNRRKSGESYPEILSINSIKDSNDEIVNYVAVFHDISDMKSKDQQLEYQYHHDALTGLPNRTLALDRIAIAISHAKRSNGRVAVCSLDIDDFKKVNDSLGHARGDMMIQAMGERLAGVFKDEDTVARLGGDEFLIVVDDIADERDVAALAESILACFRTPFTIKDHELYVTPSIGVSLYPDDGEDALTLIQNADMAMHQSKAFQRNSYSMFTQDMNERISRRIRLENDMRDALRDKDFTVYFQPKIELATGRVSGMEALVRWTRKDGTIVSPGDFIPLAEETGMIVPLGEFVLEQSCKAMQILDGLGCEGVVVAVNLSPVQFSQGDLLEMISTNLDRNGLAASRLELEVTESTLMTDVKTSVATLNALSDQGISIAIDDFGTGYSSLYYLKNFPIDVLKIDQSFIRDITTDESDAQIVETIILMAKNLGIGVVAEGVETREQLDMLDSYGCKIIQGYYYSRPIPLEDLIIYLRSEDDNCKLS